MLNPKVKPDPPLRTSLLSDSHLIDSLTSHIALYNSSSSSQSTSPNPNPRSSILKWFQSLSVPQRQSHLTIIDPNFVQILIQMLTHLHHSGHGFFIILPDLPSHADRTLPSLCYKKSDGLLSRVSESNRAEKSIFDSVRIFSSKEGENVRECSVSMSCLDSVSVSEEFVENVDSFVGIMDCLSNGRFLRWEESGLGKDWVELGWLKDKGYYSIEAFIANRLEVTLRFAWLSCAGNNGRKRGVKLKEKNAGTLSGVAENIFWRKKGCVDWWWGLDVETRRKVLAAALGKSARALSQEILVEANGVAEDKQWTFGIGGGQLRKYNHNSLLQRAWPGFPTDAEFGSSLVQDSLSKKPGLARASNHLFVLQEVVTIIRSCLHSACDQENLFYSRLSSVGTLSDCIHRKVRGFLMFISLESTKLELLGEGNSKLSPYKSKEKLGTSTRKKKGKSHNNSKNTNSIASSVWNHSSGDQLHEDVHCTSQHSEKSMSEFSKTPINPQNNGSCEDKSSIIVEMESVQHLVTGKGEIASRKSKREKRKNKKSILNTPAKDKSLEKDSAGASSPSIIPHDGMASLVNCLESCHSSSMWDSRKDNVPRKHILASKNGHTGKDGYTKTVDESCPVKLVKHSSSKNLPGSQFSNTVAEDSCLPSELEILKLEQNCKGMASNYSLSENASTSISEGGNLLNSVNINSNAAKLDACLKQTSGQNDKERSFPPKDIGDSNGSVHVSTLDCQSYEWPNAAASHFPGNSHLPQATDRLHLDVGLNWQNHFLQPFLPPVHQTRNHPIENGCKQILARPLPMSLDWPPMVRSASGLASSFTCNYDARFISRRQSAFHQGFSTHVGQHSLVNNDEKKHSGDFTDMPDSATSQERVDEYDSQWFSEEELEVHGVSGLDYNQYFGGGVMYWNPSDHPGTGYSRPPSLSSDDSFWAWQEADINRAVDDMVAFSSSYSTNGLASPTAASFCSPFDPLSSGHQALGYVVQGNEVPGQVLNSSSSAIAEKVGEDEVSGSLASLPVEGEVKTGDSLPYPVLRPIIIPSISRERSSPRPLTRREQPRIKRPPSPVVLCVPRAPRPPPPSPVGDSRKHRGFPTVRSGSSSPRNWGMRGCYHDGGNLEEGCLCVDGAEVVLPSWRNNNLSSHPMIQPLPGSLLQDRLIAISHLARDQEHPDVAFRLQPPELQSSSARKVSLMLMHSCLHDEIDAFCKQVAAENLSRKPFINWAVKRVTRSLQVLWPRSRTNIFGSNATGLSLPSSDVDLVVCLPPVRNLEPIKEAGILEGRNGIKETCLQHAARYLANQEWVKNDSLKTLENTAIPIIKLVVEVPQDLVTPGASNVPSPKEEQGSVTGEQCSLLHASESVSEDTTSPKSSQENSDDNRDSKFVRLDISFKSVSHTGLETTELVKELTEQCPAATPLALVLKQFLADRSLDQSYSGGLSSYCLVILITRFLQHEHHLGRSINQNFGSLLMDFLYFFGNVFDPRQMRISVQGSGLYMKRERGYSIDPLHIDDPLFPANNVGRNCFRIHQCIKAFSEAYSILEEELTYLSDDKDNRSILPYKLLPKIIPSIETL